jgi:hypothetical protein
VRLEGDAWSRYFRDVASSAFRLELRQVYTMPGEAQELRRFRARQQPPAGYHYKWLDTVAEARRACKTMRRVRVVQRPLTDYTQYEFSWGFAYNVEAGEDIRILAALPRCQNCRTSAWGLSRSIPTCRTGRSIPSRSTTSA